MSPDDAAILEETRGMMERQTQQLITLVDDLLDVSRITRGRLELRKCRINLADVVQSALEASGSLIKELAHDVKVELPDQPLWIDGDPHRLAQVISNLLNNAAKYTPEGGRIELIIERQGSDVVISIKDTGIGIPPGMLSRIFDMFAQIDRQMERGYTGLGVGLTLVKSLVEMHGGSIEVRSEGTNRGSEFRVRLPIVIDLPTGDLRPESLDVSPNAMGLRILVVDDNRAAADLLSKVVKLLGNDVRTAYDGQQAVEAATEFLPDVIVMDLGMPTMSGYEAARHIRQQAWGESMMLIALTGWSQEEDKLRTREAGFDHHMVKPPQPAELQRLFRERAHTAVPALI
jgi:CheY-like chemotaxis protein